MVLGFTKVVRPPKPVLLVYSDAFCMTYPVPAFHSSLAATLIMALLVSSADRVLHLSTPNPVSKSAHGFKFALRNGAAFQHSSDHDDVRNTHLQIVHASFKPSG